jgi:hypothetical protein
MIATSPEPRWLHTIQLGCLWPDAGQLEEPAAQARADAGGACACGLVSAAARYSARCAGNRYRTVLAPARSGWRSPRLTACGAAGPFGRSVVRTASKAARPVWWGIAVPAEQAGRYLLTQVCVDAVPGGGVRQPAVLDGSSSQRDPVGSSTDLPAATPPDRTRRESHGREYYLRPRVTKRLRCGRHRGFA